MSPEPQGDLESLLPTLPAISLERRLVRCIPYLDFEKGRPPRFLFTSGRRNRCNPEGVPCLYFSQDEATADLEYGRPGEGSQPSTSRS